MGENGVLPHPFKTFSFPSLQGPSGVPGYPGNPGLPVCIYKASSSFMRCLMCVTVALMVF